jgi:hypothetical protein
VIRQGPTKHFVAAEKRIVPDEPYRACKILSLDLRGKGGLQTSARIGTLIRSTQIVDRRSVHDSTDTSLTFKFKKATMHQQITQRRTIPLFLLFTACFSLSVLPAAEEPQEQSSHETLWRQTQGEWIRYSGDQYFLKKITRGQSVLERYSQVGKLLERRTAEIQLASEGGIHRFIESSTRVEQPNGKIQDLPGTYVTVFKITPDIFWEVSLGRKNQRPQVSGSHAASDPGQALLIAARRGDQETVITLLEEKVEIDFTTHDSYTALAYAAGAGHLDLVKLLLQRGADVNKRGWLAKTPFAVAVEGGHLEVLKFLVAQKADIHTRVQHGGGMINDAVFWGQPEVLEYLISLGLPVNDAPPRNLWTPLHNATWRLTRGPEHLRERVAACVKILLAHGADKNAKNRDGQTPLSIYGGVTGVAGPLFEEK